MISYVGAFVLCPLLGPCYNAPLKPYSSMQACAVEAYKAPLGICRKFKGKKYIGYISFSSKFGNSVYGDVK